MESKGVRGMGNSNSEIFSGTVEYYTKYRIAYPADLLEMILDFCRAEGKGRLLDLGCGTGQLAIPLSSHFQHVIGIDISNDMIREAKAVSLAEGANNTRFFAMESEKIGQGMGSFNCVVCGNAFHWMDRELVLEKAYEILQPAGKMVILAGGSVWTGQQDWQKETVSVIKKWLGDERRAGKSTYSGKKRGHEDFIRESKFYLENKGDYRFTHVWKLDDLIGYLYSTSFCKRGLFGDNLSDFEGDLRKRLLHLNPKGIFEETVEITYFFLSK